MAQPTCPSRLAAKPLGKHRLEALLRCHPRVISPGMSTLHPAQTSVAGDSLTHVCLAPPARALPHIIIITATHDERSSIWDGGSFHFAGNGNDNRAWTNNRNTPLITRTVPSWQWNQPSLVVSYVPACRMDGANVRCGCTDGGRCAPRTANVRGLRL